MPETKEKRATPREPAHLVAIIEADGKEIGCGVSRDASGTGFLLLTHLDIAPNDRLLLRVFVPGEEEPRKIEATVVRSERIQPTEGIVWDYRLAVALHDPPPGFQELVHRLVKRPSVPAP